MCFPHTSQIQRGVVCNQERSETQLQNAGGPQTAKALGFSLFLVDVSSRKKVAFSMICAFWVVSVQPNLQRYFTFGNP